MEEIMVSVLTTAYNHAPYIRDAIESIVNQKTDFKFELIIHDDASTDGTADIIREYAEKYPDIIRPIYQIENQYSKGISPYLYTSPLMRGKYVAICEGDDFWCDEHKLQKQVDYMESHPNCSMCIHNTVQTDVSGKKIISKPYPVEESRIVSTEEVIEGGGGYCATNSILTTRELSMTDAPYLRILSIDYSMQIHLASLGEVYCFADVMSAYRRGVPVSWSTAINAPENAQTMSEHLTRAIEMLRSFDEATQKRYTESVQRKIANAEFAILRNRKDWKLFQSKKYRSIFMTQPQKKKMLILAEYLCPGILQKYQQSKA